MLNKMTQQNGKGYNPDVVSIFQVSELGFTLICINIGTPKTINFPFVQAH